MRSLTPLALAALALAGCATTASLPPTQVIRYHLGDNLARGTVAIQPANATTPSLEFQNYAGAVQAELARIGYAPAAPGALADFVAITDFHAIPQVGPPRRSPISVGLGVGGFRGGGYRGGTAVGGDVGVGFPVGGGGRQAVLVTDLSITIKRRADQTAVWEGKAHGVVDARKPDATPPAQAQRLAAAMFTGFPGESGRTIEVK
ncbi:DUF4136 domain-containing protein [Sphingomonas bacterium]|uniref:DUF4136 domain-containing protein n=1 Tax=Sphingomonas bacterium TaxID=1895847 RepID=UPI0020C5D857|nr:DUF4136 domain-containing protein [Sphingomonas bacterium]